MILQLPTGGLGWCLTLGAPSYSPTAIAIPVDTFKENVMQVDATKPFSLSASLRLGGDDSGNHIAHRKVFAVRSIVSCWDASFAAERDSRLRKDDHTQLLCCQLLNIFLSVGVGLPPYLAYQSILRCELHHSMSSRLLIDFDV